MLFVIIDNRSNNYKFKQILISELSNRNTGIGFDQLIFLEKSKNNFLKIKLYLAFAQESFLYANATTSNL